MAEIPCICPALPDGEPRHATDTVDLRPRLGFRDVDTIMQSLRVMYRRDGEAEEPAILSMIREQYLLIGVESWSLIGADGEPIPVSKATIREYLLANFEASDILADAADDLYAEAVLRPLVKAGSNSSPPTQTEPSTSPPTGSSNSAPPTPSSPSSITTTRTDAIETTTSPPAGDSSSSPNLASVA